MERAMFLAVILTALEDMSGGKKAEVFEAARRWVFDTSEAEDFEAVCECAGVQPDRIRARCRAMLPAALKAA